VGKTLPALSHHLDQVPEAELVAQLPADAQDDHLAVKVPPCKQLFDATQLAHRWSSTLRKTNVPDRTPLFAPEPSWLAFRLSFALFVRLYPHDGQDSLGSLGLAVFVLPIAGIAAFEMLYKLQRRL
jgi:hypothetical protein